MNLFVGFFFYYFCLVWDGGEGALMMMMMMLSLFWPVWDDGLATSPALLSCDQSDVKSAGGGFGGSIPPHPSQIPAPEDPGAAALGLSRGISPLERDGIPRGFGEEVGRSRALSPLWVPQVPASILGALLSSWKWWWKGRNPSQNLGMVGSPPWIPVSQNRGIPGKECSNLTLLEMRSQSLAPSPELGQGVGHGQNVPNPAPNPSGCSGVQENPWGRCWLTSLPFSPKTFSCSSQKNPWAFHITDHFRVWGVPFNPKVSWSPFVFVHLYYYYYFIIIKRM